MGFASVKPFNITASKVLITNTAISSVSLTTASLPSSFFRPSSPTLTQSKSPIKTGINSKLSSDHEHLYISIIASLGLFIIFIALGFVLKYHRKTNQHPETRLPKSTTASLISYNNQMLSFQIEQSLGKSELPTAFNSPRVIKSTFPVKCELPGKDNEIPSSMG